jgi:hypothetical protein
VCFATVPARRSPRCGGVLATGLTASFFRSSVSSAIVGGDIKHGTRATVDGKARFVFQEVTDAASLPYLWAADER